MEKNIQIKDCKKIETRDAYGQPNGWVLEIVSDGDGFTQHLQGQMYLTVAAPRLFKGYHAHATADYFVTCIKGRIREIVYTGRTERKETEMGDGNFKTVFVPKGSPHAIENIGQEEAYVLIYRHPSWSPEIKEQLDIAPEDIDKEESWQKLEEFCSKFK